MFGGLVMERLNGNMAPAPVYPVKVLQFGEGNFLRAFVDYFIDIMPEKTDFGGSVALVKPISIGELFPAFKEQDYRYTVVLRGLVDGKEVTPDKDNKVYTEDIFATGFSTPHTVELIKDGNTVSKFEYNVNAYVQSKHDSDSIGSIVKAISNYGKAATAFASVK